MKIKTTHAYPPIPVRYFDWLAYDDDTYGGPGSKLGTGPTEEDAIRDLIEQILEEYEE